MKIEKKLILCSILAIAIGIATVIPLAYLMSPAQAQTDTNDQPQFNFDMPYAYVRDVWDNSTLTQDTYGWAFAFTFKTSPAFELTDDSVAYYETYRAELTSEKGSIANISLKAMATSYTPQSNTNGSVSVSTSYTGENISDASALNDFALYYDQSWHNFTYGDTEGSAGGYNDSVATNYRNGFGDNWNLSSGSPESLTLTIYRETWIIRTVNSTEIHVAGPEAIQTIQLQRYGNGFIYNTVIPQDEMDAINPLFPAYKIK
ncbi:MAG: hypothetical protein NWE93_01905 [Candidatus Bathyarchaeota archaeon]|nr:hypothetical protein [Candidatus Bathyarchaeota archaeon]